MAVILAVAFGALSLVALGGIARAEVDTSWQPFPPVVMAAVAVGLALLGIG